MGSVLAGLFVGVITVGIIEMVGHTIFPVVVPLEDVKPEDVAKAIAKFMDELPLGAIIFVLIAWCAGAFLGSAMAAIAADV